MYTAYEVGMRLRAAWQEMEKMDERARSLEEAKNEHRELRKAKVAEPRATGQSNPIVDERVTQRLLSPAIADRDTASMFVVANAKARGYEEGFHAGRKVGVEKTKDTLAEEVCRCEILLSLLYPNFSALMEAFFISLGPCRLYCKHACHISIGNRMTYEPLGHPFFHNWVSLASQLCLGSFDLS